MMWWRKCEERLFYAFMLISTASLVILLLLILLSIFIKGVPYLSWEMISQTPKGGITLVAKEEFSTPLSARCIYLRVRYPWPSYLVCRCLWP
jgi:ABC-type phosphate transport system permease subunit